MGCEEGLVCGVNNCEKFHKLGQITGIMPATDCCEGKFIELRVWRKGAKISSKRAREPNKYAYDVLQMQRNICYHPQIRVPLQRPKLLLCMHPVLATRIVERITFAESSAGQVDAMQAKKIPKGKNQRNMADFVNLAQSVKSTVIPRPTAVAYAKFQVFRICNDTWYIHT